MKKFLFKPVMNMLAQRDAEINDMYQKAEEAQKNAEEMESEYTKKLSLAKEEASKIMKEATYEATLKGEAIVSDAQKKAKASLEKAEKQDIKADMMVEEGTSAIDMLYSYADANNIEVVLDENSPTIYVISIDGVEQSNDAGWVYEIDDEMTMDAADEIILEEGMKITWEYMSWGEF